MISSENLMRMALSAAARGTRAARPNPRVGCAIETSDGSLVWGFHQKCGGPHAEVEALAECARRGLSPAGATVAVTLEPCSHHGRTPPCADALIAAGVKKALVGIEDPFAEVSGRGIRKLAEAGIDVELGVLSDECEALNREWLFAQRHARPFVTLKMATSLDGLWSAASGESKWITGPEARARGHELRARVDAIVTGAGTVRADNPSLTARSEENELPDQPKVFVLSRSSALDLSQFKLAQHPGGAQSRVVEKLEVFLSELAKEGVHDLMVEAGPSLSSAFLDQRLVDEIWLFLGARFFGGAGAHLGPLANGHLPGRETEFLSAEKLGEDLLLKLKPRHN